MNWTNSELHDRADTTVTSRTTFDDPRGAPPSIAIVTALAGLEETPPSRTDFTLADEVDPDALDDLVTGDTPDVRVEFTVGDYLVVVQGNGMVQIRTVGE